MAKRDFYEVLGVAEGRVPGRDKESLPAARNQAPSRPQPRGQGARRRSSRRPRRPTRSSRTTASARPTTSTALRASTAWASPRPRISPRSSRGSRTSSGTSAGSSTRSSAGAARGGGLRPRLRPAGLGPALRHGDQLPGGGLRRQEGGNLRAGGALRRLQAAPARTRAAGRKLCPTCGGSGQVRRNSGFFSIASTCPSCNGEGEIIEKPCTDCRGTGTVRRNRTITDHHSRRHRGRQAAQPFRPGRCRRKRRPRRGPVRLPPRAAARAVRAGREGRLLRGPHLHHPGGPWRGHRRPHAGRQDRAGDRACGHAERKDPPPQGGRDPRAAQPQQARGHVHQDRSCGFPRRCPPSAKELLKELASVSGEEKSPRPIPLSELKQ